MSMVSGASLGESASSRGPLVRIRDGWRGFCNHVNENPKNWVPLFMLACLMFFVVFIRNDSDMWFLIANGREILAHGFPHEDYLSMHEGLHFVLQQWSICVADAFFYDTFGNVGLMVWVLFVCCVCSGIISWVVYVKSHGDWAVVCWLTFLGSFTVCWIGATPRPMIFSAMSVLLLAGCFEMWSRTKSVRWAVAVVAVSLFQANTHATFWPATFAMLVLYSAAFLVQEVRSGRIPSRDVASLLFMVGGFWIIGFVNPYGYESIFQIVYTIGYNDVYSTIIELQPIKAESFCLWAAPMLVAIALHAIGCRLRDVSVFGWADALMVAATFVMMLGAARSVLFFCACSVLLIADIPRASRVSVERVGGRMPLMGRALCAGFAAFAVAGFLVHADMYQEHSGFTNELQQSGESELAEFFSGVPELTGKSVFSTSIIHGQYLFANYGLKPYMDARLETYLASVNQKADIFREYESIKDGELAGMQRLFDTNPVDYVVVSHSDKLDTLLQGWDQVRLVFSGDRYSIFERVVDELS